MFGIRRRNQKVNLDWPALLALLEDDDRRAAIQQLAPTDRRESYLAALRRVDSEAAERTLTAGRQLHSATALVNCPTVAVAGMLNSGKTSLVSTFLSQRGSERTLRGSGNHEGTHRFVLWLPEAWKKDPQLWGLLMSRIGDALGAVPEQLADSPAEAHEQYNNRKGGEAELQVPLVATDAKLDAAGIGLLDCPDIVSDASLGLGSPEQRRRFLGQAATLCSAFLVVTSAESSRDAALADLFHVAGDLMPGLPRFLAVNKIRPPQTPDQVFETFRHLAETHGVETVYGAYDFDVPKSRPFIPNSMESGEESPERNNPSDSPTSPETHPTFYSLQPGGDHNPPAMITEDRFLTALPSKLDRGELFEGFQSSLRSRLQTVLQTDGLEMLQTKADESLTRAQEAQMCLLNTALDFFAHRDVAGEVTELRLHQNERIVRQLSEAFASTAPWYVRWGVRLNATVQRVFGGVRDFIKQLTPTALARRAAEEVKDKFKRGEFGGVLTPEKLVKSLERNAGRRKLSHWIDEGSWLNAAETAIVRYEQDDFTSLDLRRLEEAARRMWTEVPKRKKLASGLTPLLALLATFAGVLTIPIDFGANAIGIASIAELFAAAGLTTLSALWAGNKSMQDVGSQAAKQQLADFHAVLCDVFGVPRVGRRTSDQVNQNTTTKISIAGKQEPLIQAQIAQREPEGPSLTVYCVRDEFRDELAKHIETKAF